MIKKSNTMNKTTFWKQMKEIDETSGKTLRANFMALVYGTSDINVINK